MTAAILTFPDQSEQPGPVERLTRAVDEQLGKMPDDATRLRLLAAAEHRFTLEYCAWRHNVATGRYDETGGLTAWDYSAVICEISQRRQRLEAKLQEARS